MRRIAAVVVVTTLVLSGCAWSHRYGDSGQSGVNPLAGLGVGDAGNLHEIWRSRDAVRYQALADADQVFAVQSPEAYTQRIEAFAADGSTGCSGTPRTCDPVWVTAAVAVGNAVHISEISHPLLTDEHLVVPYVAGGQFVVSIYDRKGLQGCTGSAPRVCSPLGTSTLFPVGPGNDTVPAIVDGDGMLFAVGWYDAVQQSAPIAAVRLADVVGCFSTSACAPRWRSSINGVNHAPAYANGRLYVRTNVGAAAFDGAGVQSCGSGVCAPLWTYEFLDTSGYTITVAHGRVVVSGGVVAAYDAGGTEACGGVPKVCHAVWRSASVSGGYSFGAVAVNGDRVIAGAGSPAAPAIQAYDLAGLDHCSTATPRVCSPQWQIATSSIVTNLIGTDSLGIAGGAAGGATAPMVLFRMDGAGCPAPPQNCTPVASLSPRLGAPVAVADGRVTETYINDPIRVYAAN